MNAALLPAGQVEIGGTVYRSCTCQWSELDISQAVEGHPVQCQGCGEIWATPEGGPVLLAEDLTSLREFLAEGGEMLLLSGEVVLYVPTPEAQDRGMVPKAAMPQADGSSQMVAWPGDWRNHRGELVKGWGNRLNRQAG